MAEKVEIIVEAVDNASKTLDGIGGKLGGLAGTLGKGLLIGVGATAAGFAVLGGLATTFVNDAKESQTVSARMEAQLASLGDSANVSAVDINKLADQLSKITGFDDEALIAGQTTLLRFGNLSKEQFETATKAATDLAAMTGMDLTSAFQQVGRALEDPQTGFGRLKRQIGDMTEEQKLAIATALEMGDTAKAQEIILDALAGKVKGAGEVMGQTFAGQMARLQLTIGNVKEDIGAALLPTVQLFADKLLAFVQSDKFQEWIQKLASWLQNELPRAIQAASQFWTTTLQPALTAIWQFISTNLIPVLQQIWQFLATYLPPAIAALSAFWTGTLLPAIQAVWSFLQTSVIPILQQIWDWFSVTIPAALNTLKAAWESDFMGIRTIFEGVWNAIKILFEAFRAAFEGDWYTFGQKIRELFESIGKTMITAAGSIIKSLIGIFKKGWEAIKNINWLELGKSIIQGLGNGIMAMGKWLLDKLVGAVSAAYNAAKGFLGIKSPSKLFLELGEMIPTGVAEGIKKMTKLAVLAASDMAAAVVPTMKPAPMMAMGGMAHTIPNMPIAGRYGTNGGAPSIVINYSPGISTASVAEFEAQFVPLVDRAMRKVNRGKV